MQEQLINLQRELKDVQFELTQKNETLGMKIDTIRSLQEQIDGYRRSQHSDSDKMRREIADMHSKIIAKDDMIQELHEKCEELI
jgi:uncharacterized coiled-coil DUF342 family protein